MQGEAWDRKILVRYSAVSGILEVTQGAQPVAGRLGEETDQELKGTSLARFQIILRCCEPKIFCGKIVMRGYRMITCPGRGWILGGSQAE
jgi:hypothetical protein